MCFGSTESTSRYDDGPRPARDKPRAPHRPLSRHEIEHGRNPKHRDDGPRYIYGRKGDIIGLEEESPKREGISDGRHARTSAPSRSRYDDEHIISARHPMINSKERRQSRQHGVASSVSVYDDEHIIGSRRKENAGRREEQLDVSSLPSALLEIPEEPSSPKTDDFKVMGDREGDKSKSRLYEDSHTHGMTKSVSHQDEEHVISANTVSGTSPGGRHSGWTGMFSGESSHGGRRVGERRIGERLVGTSYGPGAYLTGKKSAKLKREKEKKTTGGRPKEYGI